MRMCCQTSYLHNKTLASTKQHCREDQTAHTTFALSNSNKLNGGPVLITASDDIAYHQAEAGWLHDLAQAGEGGFLELLQTVDGC